MKKSGFILAILALMLVSGLAFVSCGGDSGPKDIEGLFDSVKNVVNSGTMWAYNTNNTQMNWCRDHSAWHPYISGTGMDHNAPAPFRLAQAVIIGGNSSTTEDGVYAANMRDTIKKLDSFYSSKYKRNVDPYKLWSSSVPDGTAFVTWYRFSLRRSGEGDYGASAVPSVSPLLVYYYLFD